MEKEITKFVEQYNSTNDVKIKSEIVDDIIRNLKIKNSEKSRKKIKRHLQLYKTETNVDIIHEKQESLTQTDSSISNYVQFGHIHKVASKTFVAACLSNGFGFKAGRDFSVKMGIKVPALSKCYNVQNNILEEIHIFARNCVDKYASKISTPRGLGFDGSWSHCRKASQCFGCFIDLLTKKIVDYYVAEKYNKWYTGNYKGSSQAMETECFSKLSGKWIGNKNIISICQDNDNDHSNIYQKTKWNVIRCVDINHNYKHFKNQLTKLMKTYKELSFLYERLARYMRMLMIRTDICNSRKIELWLNVKCHLIGKHESCDHGPLNNHNNITLTENEYDNLAYILSKTSKYATKTFAKYNTQCNESFHSLKAIMAPKQKSWKCSFKARVELGILRWNEGDAYYLELCEHLGIPLDLWQENEIKNNAFIQEKRRIIQRTDEYNKIRKKWKSNKNSEKPVKYGYKTNKASIKKVNDNNIINKNMEHPANENQMQTELALDLRNYIEDSLFESMPIEEIDNFFDDVEIKCSDISCEKNALNGIKNIGNTCFVSSILQMLWSHHIFQEICRYSIIPENEIILKSFMNAFHNMELNNPVDVSAIIDSLENTGKIQYRKGEQADCAELLEFLIDSMKEVCDCNIFTFSEKIIEICPICNIIKNSEFTSNILRIHCDRLSHTIDLTELISKEFGNINRICLNSDNHSIFSSNYITLLPMILIIQLDRVDSEGLIRDRCTLPLKLKSTLFTELYVDEHEYQLSSIICYFGSDKKGHYVCYVRCGSAWARCDEEITYVENINNSEILKYSCIISYKLIEK